MSRYFTWVILHWIPSPPCKLACPFPFCLLSFFLHRSHSIPFLARMLNGLLSSLQPPTFNLVGMLAKNAKSLTLATRRLYRRGRTRTTSIPPTQKGMMMAGRTECATYCTTNCYRISFSLNVETPLPLRKTTLNLMAGVERGRQERGERWKMEIADRFWQHLQRQVQLKRFVAFFLSCKKSFSLWAQFMHDKAHWAPVCVCQSWSRRNSNDDCAK